MKVKVFFAVVIPILLCSSVQAQNCCAPAVAQQGIVGETVTLPKTLEVGFHYEYLRSRDMYSGGDQVDDPNDTEVDWYRGSMTLSYGIFSRLSTTLIAPYIKKVKKLNTAIPVEYKPDGIGDISLTFRFGLIPRNFVTFRELAVGIGIKMPTGSTDREYQNFKLPGELQPGTGSWDFQFSASFFQGFEPVDFIVSGTYVMTTTHDDYKFGNQFFYMVSSNFHLMNRLDFSVSVNGSVNAKDKDDDTKICTTGRHQIWFSPGIQFEIIPLYLRCSLYAELPVYQHFSGTQLSGDYNLRLSLMSMIPLSRSEE